MIFCCSAPRPSEESSTENQMILENIMKDSIMSDCFKSSTQFSTVGSSTKIEIVVAQQQPADTKESQ